MLSKEIKIDNLIQDEHKLSWQLILYKRSDRAAKNNKMNLLVEKAFTQGFNTFLPSLNEISFPIPSPEQIHLIFNYNHPLIYTIKKNIN